MSEITKSSGGRIVDMTAIARVDEHIAKMAPSESEVIHRFTPGLYTRQITMQAGSEHRSKIHGTEHQFIVSQGSCIVSENDGPGVLLLAPYHGITRPGTWRRIFVMQPTVWTTMHPTDKKTVEEVEKDIMLSESEVSS